MASDRYETYHIVMASDLNHHQTLFAGQCARWFVESGFMAAAHATSPEHVVCVNIHGMAFKKAVSLGAMIRFESRIVLAGHSSLLAYVRATVCKSEELIVDGFITFIHVDAEGHALPHGMTIEAVTEEEIALQERAKPLLSVH